MLNPVKRALITGIRGQDGSYLAEQLLDRGYKVYGLMPHRNQVDMSNLYEAHGRAGLTLIDGDMTDPHSVDKAIRDISPTEIYNLAAQSFVGKSWEMPGYTMAVNCTGFINILESVIRHKLISKTRVYQASTSEMFGKAGAPQREETPFAPCSPYGVSKVAAHMVAQNYRDSYDMFVSCGILFNHESPRRPPHFLTQKVCKAVVDIKYYGQKKLKLGNLEAQRDWGWAPDYVDAMWRMLQLDRPMDLVIGTGETHSVEYFVAGAFNRMGLTYTDHVEIDPDLVRPVDVPVLLADCEKARKIIQWEPVIKCDAVIDYMVEHWEQKAQ